jgi:NACHT domain
MAGPDFSDLILTKAHGFVGREFVFAAIDHWLADWGNERVFLLTGGPGSGKTTIAARLVQISHGAIAPPAGLHNLQPGFLSSFHFFSRYQGWNDPYVFTESLARQLAERYPNFEPLMQPVAAASLSELEAFDRYVVWPLAAQARAQPRAQIVMLIDALDEALDYAGSINSVRLLATLANSSLPVCLLATTRSDPQIQHLFVDSRQLSLRLQEEHLMADLGRYVRARLHTIPEARQGMDLRLLEDRIIEYSQGNMLFAHLVLDTLQTGGGLGALESLPRGLAGLFTNLLYQAFPREEQRSKIRPLLAVLSVAQMPLSSGQLSKFTGLSRSDTASALREMTGILDKLDGKYRFFHQALSDYLHQPELPFWVDERRCHQVIADYYLSHWLDDSGPHA